MFETGQVMAMINHTNEISIRNLHDNMHLQHCDRSETAQTSDTVMRAPSGLDSFFSGMLLSNNSNHVHTTTIATTPSVVQPPVAKKDTKKSVLIQV